MKLTQSIRNKELIIGWLFLLFPSSSPNWVEIFEFKAQGGRQDMTERHNPFRAFINQNNK